MNQKQTHAKLLSSMVSLQIDAGFQKVFRWLSIAALLILSRSALADSRPNFLFIAVDDLNDFAGYASEEPGNFLQTIYPDSNVRADVCKRLTPNLDRLANKSAPFVRAYCPSALCGPSRTSLMTGVAPYRSGYYGHSRHFRTYETLKDAITLPQQLKSEGYFTTGLGKLFHKPTGNADGPIKNDWADARFSWSVWLNHATGCNGGQFGKYSPPKGGNMVFGRSHLTLKESGDWMAADFAAKLLEHGEATMKPEGRRGDVGPSGVKLPGDQPFFLGCGLFRPHLPFVAPAEFFDRFPTEEMSGLNRETLAAIVADLDDLPTGAERFTDFRQGKMRVVMDHARSLGKEEEIPGWRAMVQSYLACICYADTCLGRLIEGYENSPHYKETVLFLWSDHGYHMGAKYHIAKQALWEEANRVQLIVHDPRNPNACDGLLRRQIVSLNDLYPTICEMAGSDVGPQVDKGASITSLINDADASPVHDHLLMTYQEGNHSIRTASHKLNRYRDGSLELYDIANDPAQRNNLAKDDGCEGIRNELLKTLTSEVGPEDSAKRASPKATAKPNHVSVKRPNVLLIITDDQNDYFAKSSGVHANTPAMDRLKRESISFTRAYCASPVCGPSRAALFSGLYPHHTGAYLNGSDPWLKSTQLNAAETLPELFQRGGYETWGMGKLFHAKLPEQRAREQWDNRASANGGFAPFADPEHQLAGKFFSVQEWDGPDRDFPDVKSADAAIEYLENRDGDQPFLMVYGLWRPHNPWTAPRRFFDQYDPDSIAFPPPGYSEDDLLDVPDEGHHLAAIFGERWKGHGDSNVKNWKRVFQGYLACTSFADWNLGRVIAALDQTAAVDNTIVIVTSDNGFHVGEKHHFGKSTLWEKSANVPMLVRLPDRRNGGSECQATVSLIDLFPTLVARCGLPNPLQQLDGNDLSRLWQNPDDEWRKPAITTYGEERFSIRSGPWRYIHYPDDTEELYDHRTDPHELNNLAETPERRELLEWFRTKVPKVWEPSLGGRNG